MFLVAPYGAEIPQLRWGQRKKAGNSAKLGLSIGMVALLLLLCYPINLHKPAPTPFRGTNFSTPPDAETVIDEGNLYGTVVSSHTCHRLIKGLKNRWEDI